VSLAFIKASNNPADWFKNPDELKHYRHYALWNDAAVFGPGDLDAREFCQSNPGKYEAWMEALQSQIIWVPGEVSEHFGLLSVSDFAGKTIEQIQGQIRKSKEELRYRWRISAELTSPIHFFRQNLEPLLRNATAVTYIDRYLGTALGRRKFSGKVSSQFFDMVIASCNRSNVTLRFASSEPHGNIKFEIPDLVENLKLTLNGFSGSAEFNLGYRKHSRFLILQFSNESRIVWEPSFSVNEWDKPTFDFDHDAGFRKMEGRSEFLDLPSSKTIFSK